MLEEEERGLVRPVQILEHPETRRGARHPDHVVREAAEGVPALLVRWQVERRGDVGECLPELRHQPGELRCRVPQRDAELGRGDVPSGGFDELHPGHV
jgi:hypothetical protein